jgi:hypothetical protein
LTNQRKDDGINMSDSDDENMEDSGLRKEVSVKETLSKPATIPKKIKL